MRFESATVPAAVMPDRSNDDGFPNTCHCDFENHGKASEDRDKSEDLPDKSNIQSFREEKRRINY
jgi:hypothetical protein